MPKAPEIKEASKPVEQQPDPAKQAKTLTKKVREDVFGAGEDADASTEDEPSFSDEDYALTDVAPWLGYDLEKES